MAPDRQTLDVAVTVTNTGDRLADECVQVYAGHQSPTLEVEPWNLVGFARSGPLQPGASTRVTVSAPLSALSHWDVDEQVHRLEPGRYRVRLGRHSLDPNALHLSIALPAGRRR